MAPADCAGLAGRRLLGARTEPFDPILLVLEPLAAVSAVLELLVLELPALAPFALAPFALELLALELLAGAEAARLLEGCRFARLLEAALVFPLAGFSAAAGVRGVPATEAAWREAARARAFGLGLFAGFARAAGLRLLGGRAELAGFRLGERRALAFAAALLAGR